MRYLASIVLLLTSQMGAHAAPGPAGIQWVNIPGGSFMMGSDTGDMEGPAHQVTVKPFEMSKSHVTNRQYKACVAAGKCRAIDSACLKAKLSGYDQPAVCVTWEEANAFAQWAGGSIPTEAQWEYAARGAGKDQTYPWGDEKPSCKLAIIHDRSAGRPGCGRNGSWPACSRPKGNTAQGLCDMAGNADQWTQDWYKNTYVGAPTDGSARGHQGSYHRVVRGSNWGQQDYYHSTWRNIEDTRHRSQYLGIRLVR